MLRLAGDVSSAVPVGIVATLVLDGVVVLRQWIWGVAALDYRLVGRWMGHLAIGRFSPDPIKDTPPVRGESVIGWTAHYIIGVAFAASLIVLAGREASLTACVITGLITSAAPFLILQPGMGLGIAASKTPRPNVARLNTIVAHLSFGMGLYMGMRIWSAFA